MLARLADDRYAAEQWPGRADMIGSGNDDVLFSEPEGGVRQVRGTWLVVDELVLGGHGLVQTGVTRVHLRVSTNLKTLGVTLDKPRVMLRPIRLELLARRSVTMAHRVRT